jgi:hypothetical protein
MVLAASLQCVLQVYAAIRYSSCAALFPSPIQRSSMKLLIDITLNRVLSYFSANTSNRRSVRLGVVGKALPDNSHNIKQS